MRVKSLALVYGMILTGCTVYAPMQPTVATVSRAGQLEANASIQLSGRVEVGALYSPLPHVLVVGSGTYRPHLNSGDATFFSTRQWEAGAGTYWPLGKAWLVSGLTGGGYAATERLSSEPLGKTPLLRARYSKLFAQVGIDCRPFRSGSFGVVYRFAQLRFDELTFYQPTYRGSVENRTMGRHEVLVYGRYDLAWGQPHSWQIQSAVGCSLSNLPLHTDEPFETTRNRLPVLLLSMGLVYCPALGRTGPHSASRHAE